MSSIVEPPPLLFSQHPQSPQSPPPFSSPPQSPNHIHRTLTPVSAPPPQPAEELLPTEDIDMSTSATLPPQPSAGQNHDRHAGNDAPMSEPDGLTNGHVEADSNSVPQPAERNVAVEVAAVDEDAMDTTPDSQGLVLSNGSADPSEAPAPNGVSQDEPAVTEQPPPPPPATEDTETAPPSEVVPPIDPPAPIDPGLQPPPPPVEPVRTDSDSSDDDDGQPWHPIQEDTSSPDEAELKEIEAGVEVSALDHDHWEKKAFPPLEDPEFTAGESGRIEWTIDNYNGTREKPNRDLVMKSQVVSIGGYDWQIKFYPKGNDSDYLSVYVECLSVSANTQAPSTAGSPTAVEAPNNDEEMATDEENPADAPPTAESSSESRETQHAPLPLLNGKTLPKRKSIAAQVSVVLYNPTEPRVNNARTCLHRYCTGSPDWGWTRFYGPYYDIAHRIRGQRQALLRDDKLAFTGYIRVINDETNCLWEHHSRDNPWDSFAMTGLQSLSLGEGANSAPGGNLISAVASWLLFKPFRQLLYSFGFQDLDAEPFARPKPLISAFQKILFMLRTQVQPRAGAVSLDDLIDALEWYGIHERQDKLDVMEVWEVLRLKLEEELLSTPFANTLDDIFGSKRDYSSGVPSYRVPVLGVSTMQGAVDAAAADLTDPKQAPPQLLTIELARQEFDAPSRSYVKLMNKVSLDDNITVRGTPYTLYGFVVHKQTLQSYLYSPVVRPEGPGSKWYNYTDGKEENVVKCLTKSQAVDAHEGRTGGDKVIGNDPVAYIALYVRDDVASTTFRSSQDPEEWEVPQWLRDEVKKQQAPPPAPPVIPPPPTDDAPANEEKIAETVTPVEDIPPPKVHNFQVIDSRAFEKHEGPGIFDAYDPKWQPEKSELVNSVELAATDGCKEIREKLAAIFKDIKDPRQIKFWFLDALRGMWGRPNLLGTGKIEYSSGSTDHYADESKQWALQDYPYSWTAYRIWVHVIDFADLPELPKEEPKIVESEPAPQPSDSTPQVSSEEPVEMPPPTSEVQVPPPPPEDTPMSEPDEPVPDQSQIEIQDVPPPAPEAESGGNDTAMAEAEVAVAEETNPAGSPPAVDVIVSNNVPAVDTEMGGTQEQDSALPPPPPPPADVQADPPRPPTPPPAEPAQPAAPPPPPDEIYFFLKFFDAEKQTLESKGSHIAPKASRVDNTVQSILGMPTEQKLELFEEEDLTSAQPIKNRRSFQQNDLHNTTIIIATVPLTEEQRAALAVRAAFADPQSYLGYRAQLRNFPSRLNGHFTYNYFSSQYYKGEIKNGHRHGLGTRIYHSGATYEGTFQLSKRHGHGLYTFQNGDTYDGEWVNNQQHGSGTFVEATTGNTYQGGWKNDKKFGEGVTHWKNAQEMERLCRICWEESADAAFYDCGHVVACLSCARRVDTCPVCRKRVLSAMKLYYVA